MEKLKPCPFCGGEAKCINTRIVDNHDNPFWWVLCNECDANTGMYVNRVDAIKTWNRRAKNAAD